MKYEWRPAVDDPKELQYIKLVPLLPHDPDAFFKMPVAFVRRRDTRIYRAVIGGTDGSDDKNFRSLKAAKAYVIAMVALNQ